MDKESKKRKDSETVIGQGRWQSKKAWETTFKGQVVMSNKVDANRMINFGFGLLNCSHMNENITDS